MKREASSNDSSEESVKTLHYDSPDDDQSRRDQSKAEQSMEEFDSSDDSYEKLNTCLECNKVMTPGQACYKNEKKGSQGVWSAKEVVPIRPEETRPNAAQDFE